MIENARPLMLRPGGQQASGAEFRRMGAVQGGGQRCVDGNTERTVVGRAGLHLVGMDVAHFRRGRAQDQEQAQDGCALHPEGQVALCGMAEIECIAPHLLARNYHKGPVGRANAFQNISSSLNKNRSSHPARLNLPRREPFDPSFCMALIT
ncbi:MAG: hypothetical protein ACYCSN_20245, partial [Acidobacteriaceae bacterium]